MKKELKKKPIYSSLSNFIWSIKMLVQASPGAFFALALLVPVNIGMQWFGIYLPSLVVSEVTAGQTLEHALISVGAVMSAMMAGDLAAKALLYVKDSKLGVYRGRISRQITRKSVKMFYQTYEKKEVRDLSSRARIATEMWGGTQPLVDIVKNGFGMIENVLGYLLFGVVISFANPWLVLFLTFAPAVNLLSVRLYQKWEYGHRNKMTDLNRKLYFVNGLPGDFSAAKDIRIYSMASWLRECYQDLSRQRAEWDKKMVRNYFLSRTADLFVILIRDGAAYALLISMVLKGEITVDEFVLYFAAVASFAAWVGGVIECWNKIHENSLAICDFREYADYPQQDGSGRAKSEEFISESPEIVFDRVCFRYDGADEDTIHDLSFVMHGGEKLALVGANGAGKTTIVKLMCGLYMPSSGEIRINGVPLHDFLREDYYKLFAPVFQDIRTSIFSLAETVSGKSLAQTDLERAKDCMRKAGLGEKLDALPQGIHTKLNKQVNKGGTELSGGEAQKLMLARALYKDAPVLILDEPTAALDPIAESRIYEEYDRMADKKTSLFISHRLASTSFCDRIILLKHGEICEEGSHEELLRRGGEYRKLFDMQRCWYQEENQDAKKGDAAV